MFLLYLYGVVSLVSFLVLSFVNPGGRYFYRVWTIAPLAMIMCGALFIANMDGRDFVRFGATAAIGDTLLCAWVLLLVTAAVLSFAIVTASLRRTIGQHVPSLSSVKTCLKTALRYEDYDFRDRSSVVRNELVADAIRRHH